MSTPPADAAKAPSAAAPSLPPPPPKQSGIRTVLRYTGIPPSWLDKRPKLPSRNWLIFLSVTSSTLGYYFYDRKQCKKIRQEYVDRVKHLAEVPAYPFEVPRRVTVYGAKWPGDEDHDQSLKYFRRYVKPILVAAAVDYTLVPGKRHGDIARKVAEEIRVRRREDSGLDIEPEIVKALPTYLPLAERRKRELAGGIVIVGRPTWKEFMSGLKRGWSDGLEKVDREEVVARILEDDNVFEEMPDEPVGLLGNDEPKAASPLVYSPLQVRPTFAPPTPPSRSQQTLAGSASTPAPAPPPATIPDLPPILFVPFLDYLGFKQIPLMAWDFFNQRHKVRAGAEAGYRLVMGLTRPLEVPESLPEVADTPSEENNAPEAAPQGDLDFDKRVEGYYTGWSLDLPEEIERAREKYYEALPNKLTAARELARGTREPTKEEMNKAPPTEVELRAERLKKERRWRDDIEGWAVVNPSNPTAWDDRFRRALRVFADPAADSHRVKEVEKASS